MSRTLAHDLFDLPEKKSINSKQKGMKNERAAAKWMQKWTGHPFTRVPSSGGMHWKDNSTVCGDIVCKEEGVNIPFSVETKHLDKIHIRKKLRANSAIHTIWEQAVTDADRGNKLPLALLRENNMPAGEYYVVFPGDLGIAIGIEFGLTPVAHTPNLLRVFKSDEVMRYVGYVELLEAMKFYKIRPENFGIKQNTD